jgi:hypothetical protein
MSEGIPTVVVQPGQQPVEYRDVPDFPGYRVGSDGSVWSCWEMKALGGRNGTIQVRGDSWRRMKTGRQKGRAEGRSYCSVRLCVNKKSRLFRVHRLVLEAFVGPCPPGHECRHLDGNPANNQLSNVVWGTPAQNAADRRRHGHFTNKARYYTHDGKTLILKDWAREVGIRYLTLWQRLATGWSFADAISTPLRARYGGKPVNRKR